MYKYETHLHTFPVSRCAKASVRDNLEFYKNAGYDGVFITNHFLGGNINIDPSKPYAEKVEFYFSDYEAALEIGQELDIKVFCGVELSNRGPDFLVYGLDKQWYLDHPEIMEMERSAQLKFMMDSGALIIQAHPFREASYIDHFQLFPKCVHGVEVINGGETTSNALAAQYCRHYDLIPFAGSDNHRAGRQTVLAGICCQQPIESMEDFMEKVRSREIEIFSTTQEELLCI